MDAINLCGVRMPFVESGSVRVPQSSLETIWVLETFSCTYRSGFTDLTVTSLKVVCLHGVRYAVLIREL